MAKWCCHYRRRYEFVTAQATAKCTIYEQQHAHVVSEVIMQMSARVSISFAPFCFFFCALLLKTLGFGCNSHSCQSQQEQQVSKRVPRK